VLWVIEKYPALTIVMISVSVIILAINYFLLRSSYKKLREMAQSQQQVFVHYRNEQGSIFGI
jgi:hypothetical protein